MLGMAHKNNKVQRSPAFSILKALTHVDPRGYLDLECKHKSILVLHVQTMLVTIMAFLLTQLTDGLPA